MGDFALNLVEAIDLLDAVSGFKFKASEEKPEFSIVDDQKEGFKLFVKAELLNENYRDYIKKMVESRGLSIREFKGYLIICSRFY